MKGHLWQAGSTKKAARSCRDQSLLEGPLAVPRHVGSCVWIEL